METPQDSRQSFEKPPSPGVEEDQEQQHGGNAVVSEALEEGIDKKGLVLSWLAQGGFDQGELSESELAGGEPAQEEPPQINLTGEATGGAEEGEKKEEEMEERHAGDGASGSEDDNIQPGGQGSNDQPQPQPQRDPELPEFIINQEVLNRLAYQRYRRTRFTHSQLHDLERLFQETRYPSLRARRDLARWMGVDECDVQNWFQMRRTLFHRNRRLVMFCELPPLPQSDSP